MTKTISEQTFYVHDMLGKFYSVISHGKLGDVFGYCLEKRQFSKLGMIEIQFSTSPNLFLNKIVHPNFSYGKYMLTSANVKVWVFKDYDFQKWPRFDDVFKSKSLEEQKEPKILNYQFPNRILKFMSDRGIQNAGMR